MRNPTFNFKATRFSTALMGLLFTTSLGFANESPQFGFEMSLTKHKAEANTDDCLAEQIKLNSAEAIELDQTKLDNIPVEVLTGVLFNYLSPLEKVQLLSVNNGLRNKLFKSMLKKEDLQEKDISSVLEQLKIEGEDYKDHMTFTYNPQLNTLIHLQDVLDSSYSFNEKRKNGNMIKILESIFSRRVGNFYELLNFCLLPQASIARTQAFELIAMHLSQEDIPEEGVFAMLFVEYLQKYGSEQMRNLVTQRFNNSVGDFFETKCKFESGLSSLERNRRKEYTSIKKLLQRQIINQEEFSKMDELNLASLSCFHENEDIQAIALSTLFERDISSTTWSEWFGLKFSLVVSKATNKFNLISELKNKVGVSNLLLGQGLSYFYVYGNEAVRNKTVAVLKDYKSNVQAEQEICSQTLFNIFQQLNPTHPSIMHLFKELTQPKDNILLVKVLLSVYQNYSERDRRAMTPFLFGLCQSPIDSERTIAINFFTNIYVRGNDSARESLIQMINKMILIKDINETFRRNRDHVIVNFFSKMYQLSTEEKRSLVLNWLQDLSQAPSDNHTPLKIFTSIYRQNNEVNKQQIIHRLKEMVHSTDDNCLVTAVYSFFNIYHLGDKVTREKVIQALREMGQSLDDRIKNRVLYTLNNINHQNKQEALESVTSLINELGFDNQLVKK